MTASLDCITRFRGSRFPLKNTAQDIIRLRRLNSKERRALLDLVFCWSRNINLFREYTINNAEFSHSLSTQQIDSLALQMMGQELGLINELAWSQVKEYHQWLSSLGDRQYLMALGDLIGTRLKEEHGERASEIAKGLFQQPVNYLAVDTRLIEVERVFEALKRIDHHPFFHPMLSSAIGITGAFDLRSLPPKIWNAVWVMDAGSQMIASLICPKPGEKVLDLCVGEGNKARLISQNDCELVICDVDEKRLMRAKNRILGAEFILGDGQKLPLEKDTFDHVLIDAPCSGTGVLRRHPDLIHRLKKEDVDRCLRLQHGLLISAIRVLKPGGRLIYATCSLLREENEHQVELVLKENSQIKPLPFHKIGSQLKLSGILLNDHWFTLYPHIHNCDGFFFASLTKSTKEKEK